MTPDENRVELRSGPQAATRAAGIRIYPAHSRVAPSSTSLPLSHTPLSPISPLSLINRPPPSPGLVAPGPRLVESIAHLPSSCPHPLSPSPQRERRETEGGQKGSVRPLPQRPPPSRNRLAGGDSRTKPSRVGGQDARLATSASGTAPGHLVGRMSLRPGVALHRGAESQMGRPVGGAAAGREAGAGMGCSRRTGRHGYGRRLDGRCQQRRRAIDSECRVPGPMGKHAPNQRGSSRRGAVKHARRAPLRPRGAATRGAVDSRRVASLDCCPPMRYGSPHAMPSH